MNGELCKFAAGGIQRMVRPNRHLLRLFFILIIFVGLFGFWYADRSWQALTQDLNIVAPGETDWVNLVADFFESSLKFFQSASSAP
jgi:hypothetical protein